MNNQERDRVERIKQGHQQRYGAESQASADIDFLLCLLQSQEGAKIDVGEPSPAEYFCPEHKYNPPPNSGFAFCPQCEIVAGNWGRGGFNVGVYIDQD